MQRCWVMWSSGRDPADFGEWLRLLVSSGLPLAPLSGNAKSLDWIRLMEARVMMFLSVLMIAAAAPSAPVNAQLARAVAEYDAAQIQGNRAALQRLLADDYLLTNSAGAVQTKPSFISDLTDPGFHLDPFVVIRPIARTWAATALRGGVVKLTGMSGGRPFESCLRFMDVWHKQGAVWRVAYSQAMRAPPQACTSPARLR
jgi:hypothetical protein